MCRLIVVALLLYCCCTPRVRAHEIPNAQGCVAAYLGTGRNVSVREHVGVSGYMAYATYDNDGWPTITYAPSYFSLAPIVQVFLSLHECGHLVLQTTDEFMANCYALSQRQWTGEEIELIEQSHHSIGKLGQQYGGSGAAFWDRTKKLCPQYIR